CFNCSSCLRKSSRVKSGPATGPAVARGVFVVGNQTSDPQCGQGASALGHEGDSRSRRRQTGQRVGGPSGVREEIGVWRPNGRTPKLSGRAEARRDYACPRPPCMQRRSCPVRCSALARLAYVACPFHSLTSVVPTYFDVVRKQAEPPATTSHPTAPRVACGI